MSTTRIILGAGLLLSVLAPVAGAQPKRTWVFTPYVGVFVPANDVAKLSAEAGGMSAAMTAKHDNALALGANASFWLTERSAIEAGGAYAFSHLGGNFRIDEGTGTTAGTANEHAFVTMGTLKFMYALLPAGSERQVRFGIGPAVIYRGGTAYKADADGTVLGRTNVGGAASLCTRFQLAGPLSLRLRAEDYMYQARLKFRDAADPSGNFTFDRRFQNDFIFSAGLQVGIGR